MKGDIRFAVRGLPIPQGNLRASVVNGHAYLHEKSKGPLSAWRHAVASAAQPYAPKTLWEGPVSITLLFTLPQPKSRKEWAGRGKNKRRVKWWPDRRPDVDKLARACLDALTNVVFRDDAQVVGLSATKRYGAPGVVVYLRRIGEED